MCKEAETIQKYYYLFKATIDYKRFSKTASTPDILDKNTHKFLIKPNFKHHCQDRKCVTQ